jgi:[ribosomal protein S5]-alanine N-acetyltransferase
VPEELVTRRLRLIALPERQLKMCVVEMANLAVELGFPISGKIVDEPVVRAIAIKRSKMAIDNANYLWYTYWLIVTRNNPFGTGLIGFKDRPDKNGEAEIGYGLDEKYWNKGYMTEALSAMRDWAFSHSDCKIVVGVTVNNPKSERVLQKCGAQKFAVNKDDTTWKIEKTQCELHSDRL